MNMPSEPAENKVVFEKFLASRAGAVVRPWLAREVGLEAAVLLNQLVYWSHHKSDKDGWFSRSMPELIEETGLTSWSLRQTLKKLVILGLIADAVKRGKHWTAHYRLNVDRVNEMVLRSNPDDCPQGSTLSPSAGLDSPTLSPSAGLDSPTLSPSAGSLKKNKEKSEQGVPAKHDRAFAAAAGGDRLVVLGELGEVGQECPSPEKQPDQQPAPIPAENSQTAQTSHPPPPQQPPSPGVAKLNDPAEDDLDYGQYSINQIESPEIRALLSAAITSQAAAVRRARV